MVTAVDGQRRKLERRPRFSIDKKRRLQALLLSVGVFPSTRKVIVGLRFSRPYRQLPCGSSSAGADFEPSTLP
jgi:hypothetical protein